MDMTKSKFVTITGRIVDALEPNPADIDVFDIAYALSHTSRYGGHARKPINVAGHSLNVAHLVMRAGGDIDLMRAALFHDAHEAYLGDVIQPVKRQLGDAWMTLEKRWDLAIAEKFSIDPELFEHPIVRRADMTCYCWERRDVGPDAWDAHDPELVALVPDELLPNPTPKTAQDRFIDKAWCLRDQDRR